MLTRGYIIIHVYPNEGVPGRVRDVPQLLPRAQVRGGTGLHVSTTAIQVKLLYLLYLPTSDRSLED